MTQSADDSQNSVAAMKEAAQMLLPPEKHLASPAAAHTILDTVADFQLPLVSVFEAMAQWYRETAPGLHYTTANGSGAAAAAMVHELEAATSQVQGLHHTLQRLLQASAQIEYIEGPVPEESFS